MPCIFHFYPADCFSASFWFSFVFMFVRVSVCACEYRSPGTQEMLGSPGTGVVGSCELPDVVSGNLNWAIHQCFVLLPSASCARRWHDKVLLPPSASRTRRWHDKALLPPSASCARRWHDKAVLPSSIWHHHSPGRNLLSFKEFLHEARRPFENVVVDSSMTCLALPLFLKCRLIIASIFWTFVVFQTLKTSPTEDRHYCNMPDFISDETALESY